MSEAKDGLTPEKKYEAINWLSEERKRLLLTNSTSLMHGTFVLEGRQKVYSQKGYEFSYNNVEDLELQFELMQRLTEKGIFPPGSEWYGLVNEKQEYCLVAIMPFIEEKESDRSKKPWFSERTGLGNREAYNEIMRPICPEFDVNQSESDLRSDGTYFWFSLLTPDAWRRDNWRHDGKRSYLVDFEGVSSVKDDPQVVQEALRRLREMG